MRSASRAWLGVGSLAEEVVVISGSERGVSVSGTDQPELVRINSKLRFHLEAVLKRRARILEFEHLRLFLHAIVEIAFVPAFEVGELVVRRKEWMRLAVAFDLRDFIQRLPAHAILGVFAVDLLPCERLDDREHDAVAQIAVMSESEHVCRRSFVRRSPSISTSRADCHCRAVSAWCKVRPGWPSDRSRRKMTLR